VRGLKTLVIVLGVLLVGGTITLIAAIVWRGTHRPAEATAGGHSPFATAFELPPGAEVATVEGEGGRLVVQLRLADGSRRLVLFDSRSGALLGTIELRPH
jgi:hypothetical protein